MKENAGLITIKVLEDFSDIPGGKLDGLIFYTEVLKPNFEKALSSNKKLIIDFDGGPGYLNSFLIGCFTSFKKDYDAKTILKNCEFKSDEELTLIKKIKDIIKGEENEKRKLKFKTFVFIIFIIITLLASCTFLTFLVFGQNTIVDKAVLLTSGSYLGSIFMYIFVIIFKKEFRIK